MIKNLLIIFTLIIYSKLSFAVQIKSVEEGAEIQASISAEDLSRVKLKGDTIVSAKANTGDINISYEESTGDIYLRPTFQNQTRVINLFLVSKKGYTYKLLLTPKMIPSAQIILRNPEIVVAQKQNMKRDDYKQSLINLYKGMSLETGVEGYKIQYTYRSNFFVKGIRSALKVKYESEFIKGYIYEIKGTKKNPVLLHESDFFSPGVLAVKLDKIILEKGERAKVYIIKG